MSSKIKFKDSKGLKIVLLILFKENWLKNLQKRRIKYSVIIHISAEIFKKAKKTQQKLRVFLDSRTRKA